MPTIYHNPRCSKSRAALELLTQFADQHKLCVHIIDYQKTPPTRAQLVALHQQLQFSGTIPAHDMLRSDDAVLTSLGLVNTDEMSDEALFDTLATHPVLLQRPIVCFKERAVIARPPERVAILFQDM